MRARVTVNFFHKTNKTTLPDYSWFDTDGHAPQVGDYIITPSNKRWKVMSRTWQEHVDALHCNIIVDDTQRIT